MLITRAHLIALDTQSTWGLDAVDAAFPDGIAMQGPPDPQVIDRIARTPFDAPALAQRLLTEQAHAAYVALEDQAQAVYKRDTLAAGGSLGHEAYAQARDAALHTLRCAQIRALWGLLQDAENVAPIQMPEPFVESKGGAIGIIARI